MTYKIDDIDRRIIYELDNNCRIPETQLAKIVGKSKEAVRYRIRKLQENKIIEGFGTWMDLTKIGFEAPKFYLRTREKPVLLKSFISHLKDRPDVFWIGTGDGAWNVGVTVFTRGNAETFALKNELFSTFRNLVMEENVGEVVVAYSIGKKFLIGERENVTPRQVLGTKEWNKIDQKDAEILRCLITDGRMSYVQIASNVKCTPEVVRMRIKALQAKNIITRYTTRLNIRKLGMERYKTFLYFEGLNKEREKNLFELANKHPNIVNYLRVLAPWDIELEIMADDYNAYNGIMNYIRERFSDVLVKVETTVVGLDELYPAKKLPSIEGLGGSTQS